MRLGPAAPPRDVGPYPGQHPPGLDARGYQRAAHALRQAVLTELSAVPMHEFVHGDLPALQTIAQNLFFETRGRFADLDGSSNTRRVAEMTSALFNRLIKQRR